MPAELIAVIHLPALPGALRHRLAVPDLIQHAVDEAVRLADHGFDGLIVENFGDAPFGKTAPGPHVATVMTRCVAAVVEAVELPVGVNILRNDARAGLAVALAAGAGFIRVNVLSGVYATDQGLIEGRAAETLSYARHIGADVEIFADIHVKHAQPVSQPDLLLAAEETAYRAGADGLIVSGSTTGRPADLDAVRQVCRTVPDKPVWVGSGVTPETVGATRAAGAGVIVGSCLREGGLAGAPLDDERITAFIAAARH